MYRNLPCVDFPELFHNVSFCFACYHSPSPADVSESSVERRHLGKDKFKMMKKLDIVSCLLSMDCEEALCALFLSLDGSSLAACSLVCTSWHKFLRQRLWRCRKVRPVLEAKLRQQWKLSRPTALDKQIEGKSKGFDIVCDDELTLVGMEDGLVKVIRNERPSRGERRTRDEEESSTVFTLDCRTNHFHRQTIQFWLGSEVIVTVGNGLVQCWNRLTGAREYKRAHHERGDYADIYAVTVLRSGMVATGANGGEVVVLHKKEKWWKWLETGKDEGPIWSVKARLVTEDRGQVCHMHTDPACNHTAIGTRRSITLWDLDQGCKVKGSTAVHQYSNMLVYVEPHAFILNGDDGVEVWNLKTGEHVKHVNIDMRFNSIGTNGQQIILSTGYNRHLRDTVNFTNSCVVVFRASELGDPKVPAEEVEWREFLRTGEVGVTRVDAAINRTGFVAVFPKLETRQQSHSSNDAGKLIVKQFDLWRADGANGGARNSLSKMERERVKNSRRRELARGQKQSKKKQNTKHVI